MPPEFPRALAASAYFGLKAAARHLVVQAGGVEAAARVTRVAKTKLGDYGNVNRPQDHMPIDVVADLEADAEEPLVTAALAALSGYRLERATSDRPAATSLQDRLLEVVSEVGAVSRLLVEGQADGVLSPAELRTLHREARAMLQAAQRLTDDLAGRLADPSPPLSFRGGRAP